MPLKDSVAIIDSENFDLITDILDTIPELVAVLDNKLCYCKASKAYLKMFDCTEKMLVGNHISAVVGEQTYMQVLPRLEKALQGEQVMFEVRLIDSSGKARQILTSYKPISRNNDGAIDRVVMFGRDISEWIVVRSERDMLIEIFGATFDSLQQGLLIVDANDLIVSYNNALIELCSIDLDLVLTRKPVSELLDNICANVSVSSTKNSTVLLQPAGCLESIYKSTFKINNARKVVNISQSKLTNGGYFVLFNDISQQVEREQKLYVQAMHDPLTTLPNRRCAYEHIDRYDAMLGKNGLALMMIDVNRFKMVNDTYGHMIGDQLLHVIGQRLTSFQSELKTIYRIGGDEFLLIWDGEPSTQELQLQAQALSDTLCGTYKLNTVCIEASVSIGVSVFQRQSLSVICTGQELLKNVDIALYYLKKRRKEKFVFFNLEMKEEFERKIDIANAIISAINEDQFSLSFQPIFCINGLLHSAKVSVCWNSSVLGPVNFEEVMLVAEETQQIVVLSNYLIRKSLIQSQSILESSPKDFSLLLSIPPAQLYAQGFAQHFLSLLEEFNIATHQIVLEVSEQVFCNDLEPKPDPEIEELVRGGVCLSIGDFAMNYSSLAKLSQVPLSALKINKSFMRPLAHENSVMIQLIVAIAQNLNINVIADGIETLDQLHFVKQKGCQYFQGILFGESLSMTDLYQLIVNKKHQLDHASHLIDSEPSTQL